MSNVKRVYVEKKPEFAVAAKGLRHEIRHFLRCSGIFHFYFLDFRM